MSKARDLANAADVLDDVSATELSYVNGVTSAIQTQIDGKSSTSHNHNSDYIAKTLTTTTGDIIYASSANNPARLGIGSTGNILTVSGGVPTWAAPAGGSGLTLISRQTGSAASSIDFNGVFTSTYQAYMIVIENLTGSTAEELRMQLKYSTSTVQTTGYYGNTSYVAFNSTTWTFYAQSNTAQCILMDGTLGSDPTGATIYITPGNAAVRPAVYGYGMNSRQGGPSIFGFQPASQTYTGFLIKASAGTITGSVSCYGLAKS
jgi:hypothetical protein